MASLDRGAGRDAGQDGVKGVLAVGSVAGPDLDGGATLGSEAPPEARADDGIGDEDPGAGVPVVEEPCFGFMHPDGHVGAPVRVEVGKGDAAALAGDGQAGARGADGAEASRAIAEEDAPEAGVLARGFGVEVKVVLGKDKVEVAVAIEVGGRDGMG